MTSFLVIPIYLPFIFELLFKVTLFHWSKYMAENERSDKDAENSHLSWIAPVFLFGLFTVDQRTTSRGSCISCSECYRIHSHSWYGNSWRGFLPFLSMLPSTWSLQSRLNWSPRMLRGWISVALDYLRFRQQGPDVLLSQKPLCLRVFFEASNWEEWLMTNN